MGAQISWLDRPDATSNQDEMPGHFEPFSQTREKVSLLEGSSDVAISGGTFNAVGRDIVNTTTTTTVNNIVINFLDGKPLSDTDILDWLSAINYRAIQMDNLEKATPGTGSWFIESEIFRQWLASQEGILWGTGIPGSGKTILASIVINYLQEYARTRGSRIAIAFAYCRYTSPVPVQQILAALVRQLLERYPFLLPVAQPIYEEHQREMTKPSKRQLLDLLKSISHVFDAFYCALDGLDEATEDDQFKLLDALSSVKANFFITSRPLEALHSYLPSARFFTVVARGEDIQRLINDKLKQSPKLTAILNSRADGPTHRDAIVNKITQKADGMFLHAALQVESLRHSVSLREVLDRLDQLPANIEDMYAETMKRIDMQPPTSSLLARRILTWVIFAKTLLTVDDLRYALAIDVERPVPPTEEIIDHLAMVDERTLLSVCCGLITVDGASRTVRLVHFTALEYLQRVLSSAEAEFLLAKTCIRRSMCREFKDPDDPLISIVDPPISIVDPQLHSHPLLQYARRHWSEHVEECLHLASGRRQELVQELAQLFLRNMDAFDPWLLAAGGDDPLPVIVPLLPDILRDAAVAPDLERHVNAVSRRGWTLLMLATYNGNIQAVLLLLRIPGIDVNRISPLGETALTIAVGRGNLETVRHLVAHPGIDINHADEMTGVTALSKALEGQRPDIACVLLDHTAIDISTKTPDGRKALLLAAMRECNEGIVRRLLTFPQTDVNQANAVGSTPLLLAIARHLRGIVAALLEHPNIDINHRDNQGSTPLLLAMEYKSPDLAYQLLGRAGLDANIAGPWGGCTALMTAAWLNHEGFARRLLELPDIQVNAVDEQGQTALAHALHCGHLEVAKLILASPGLDINLERPSDGLTPLMMVAMMPGLDISNLLHLLLQYPGIDVNHQTNAGLTALMLAAYHGNVTAVRLLVENPEIDVNLKMDEGWTALDVGRSRGHEEAVVLLVDTVANI